MESQLDNIEYYDKENNYWRQCTIKGIYGEKSFIVTPSASKQISMASSKSIDNSNEIIVSIENLRKRNSTNTISSTTSECEYEIKDHCFMPCKIKSQKGKFYSILLLEDERTVRLTRESKLRQVNTSLFSTVIFSSYSNIVLPIPNELANWFGSDSYNEMIKNIQEDPHDPVTFYINCFPISKPISIRVLCPKDKADLIKLIIDTAIEHELKLRHLDNDKVTTLEQLKTVQALNKVFIISEKYMGMLIGAKGKNIKYLTNTYQVSINLDKINEHLIKVTISGNNEENVEKCYLEMNLKEQIYEIRYGFESVLKEQAAQLISEYHLKSFYVCHYEVQDDKGLWYHAPNLQIIGPDVYLEELLPKIKYYIKTY